LGQIGARLALTSGRGAIVSRMTDLNDPAALMCHFTRSATAFEKILPERKLWMNPYSTMRDPFENQYPFIQSAAGGGDDADAENKLFWSIQRKVALSREPHSLLALTEGDPRPGDAIERDFRCPWSRPRMWEQYAENHAGACLIFDREQLLEALRDDLEGRGSYWEGSVNYTVAGYAGSVAARILLSQFHEDALEEEVDAYVQHHYKDFFFLKTEDWATEFEYRFVFERNTEPNVRFLPAGNHVSYGDALRWVLVGEHFPDWQLPGAEAVAQAANVELRRMSWDLNRPYPAKAKKRDRPRGRP
jgi:hypothetical protein